MPTTLGDRIEKALADADMTVQALADTLEEEGVDGGSYANLHRLKSNKMERPSAGLLYGIAKVTEVRVPWLVADDGPMTEEEARKWTEAEAGLRERIATEEEAALWPALREFPWMENCPPVVQAALVDHLSERSAARWRQDDGELFLDEREEAEEIWERILEPLDGTPLDWSAFKEYALAAIHALNLALRIETAEED